MKKTTAASIPPTFPGGSVRCLRRSKSAAAVEQMNRPGFRLHALKGDLAGYWSVSVSGNWRIIFRFEDETASDIDLVDYH